MRRVDVAEVEALDRSEDRQNHEGQESVDQSDQHSELGIQERQRLADQTEAQQQAVDRALLAQQNAPGIGADQKIRPEGQNHQEERDLLNEASPAGSDEEGERIANQQADDCGQRRQPNRALHDDEEDAKGAPVVFEREGHLANAAASASHEADDKHDDKRQYEEYDQPDDGRQGEQ